MKRHRRPPISNINVVPYLDVLLVLLVIFMVTAPLFNQGTVEVPKVSDNTSPDSTEKAPLEIEYEKSAGGYRLIDHKDNSSSAGLSDKELIAELRKKAILYEGKKTRIIISADSNLLYQDVFDLLGKLYSENFENIALTTQGKE